MIFVQPHKRSLLQQEDILLLEQQDMSLLEQQDMFLLEHQDMFLLEQQDMFLLEQQTGYIGIPGNLLSSRRTNSSRENPMVLAGRIRTARTPEFLQEFTQDEFVPRDSARFNFSGALPADPYSKRRLPQCTESLYYH